MLGSADSTTPEMNTRRTEGAETWHRLREWDRGQAPAERLAAQILQVQGYDAVDPAHPLGGPDGLRDALCQRGGVLWIAAVYFPRGQQSFTDIRAKFLGDLKGVEAHKAQGIAFVVNQELRLAERDELTTAAAPVGVDIFHLERLASILNSPPCYGLRLEFLDIEMTKEEQLAFLASRDIALEAVQTTQQDIIRRLESLQKEGQARVPAQPFTVSPVLSSSTLAASIFGYKLQRCTICGFGYFVRRSPLWFSFGATHVACPKCGNVDEVPRS
jgi:hypothetical protein